MSQYFKVWDKDAFRASASIFVNVFNICLQGDINFVL